MLPIFSDFRADFTSRVFKLTKNKCLVVFLATLSIGGYVCAWIGAVKGGNMKE
jgi:hypothetical protein